MSNGQTIEFELRHADEPRAMQGNQTMQVLTILEDRVNAPVKLNLWNNGYTFDNVADVNQKFRISNVILKPGTPPYWQGAAFSEVEEIEQNPYGDVLKAIEKIEEELKSVKAFVVEEINKHRPKPSIWGNLAKSEA